MRAQSIFLPLAATSLLLAACAHPRPTPTPSPDPLSAQTRWEMGQAAYMEWNGKRAGWTTTPSGIQYKRIKAARKDAPQPVPGATVTIHYTGTFIDGRVFDSSRERGEPATFPLPRLIKGWQEGVPLMRKGERFLFVIPSRLAYGPNWGGDKIPGGSTLIFDIELIDIPPAD